MDIHIHTTKLSDLAARDRLLQRHLREENDPLSISDEYPIVLSHYDTKYSLCLRLQSKIVAHLNYWPRNVVDAKNKIVCKVGLIGNVVSCPSVRGKGYIRKLFEQVHERCLKEDIRALILWSDLNEFYKKLGFTPFGSERRITLSFPKISQKGDSDIKLVAPGNLSLQLLQKALCLRPQLAYTIQRSLREYMELLTIPECYLFGYFQNSDLKSFAIVGKGSDMRGVIHEWGYRESPDQLGRVVQFIQNTIDQKGMMLLAPSRTSAPLESWFADYQLQTDTVPMAHMFEYEQGIAENLSSLFVWGMDSI